MTLPFLNAHERLHFPRDVVTTNGDLARSRRGKPGERIDERGLSCTVWPDETDHLARLN